MPAPEGNGPGYKQHQGVYREHQFLWNFFEREPEAERDFLFRRFDLGRTPLYYLLSERKPVAGFENWRVETKEFDPLFKKGQLLTFQLRANAVVTKIPGGHGSKKRKRVDVYLDGLRRNKDKPVEEQASNNEVLVQTGMDWLEKRAEKWGFTPGENRVLVEGYQRLIGRKKGQKSPITLGAIDFSGVLTVMDPDALRANLFQGLGPAKSFGCGLLLLKPA